MAYIGTPAAPVATAVGDNAVTTRAIAPNAVTPPKLGNGGSELSFRNRIINGDMRIDQRNAGASVTVAANDRYVLDRFVTVGTYGGNIRTVARIADGPSITTPFCHNTIQTGSNEGPVTDDYCTRQAIELQNIYDLAGKDVTASFWYKSNRAGTHGIRLIGNYAAGSTGGVDQKLTFTVNSANTWEYKTITFTALKNLTSWGAGASNAGGIILDIGFRCATFGQPAVSVNDYFRITEVQLEAGTVASPFERRDYGRELIMCQRYYYKSGQLYGTAYGGAQGMVTYNHPVTMRTLPTTTGTITTGSLLATFASVDRTQFYINTTTASMSEMTASAEL